MNISVRVSWPRGFPPVLVKETLPRRNFTKNWDVPRKLVFHLLFFLYFLKNTMIGMIVVFNNQLNQTSLKNLNPCLERLEIFSFVQALHLLEQSEQKDETFHCTSSKIQFE